MYTRVLSVSTFILNYVLHVSYVKREICIPVSMSTFVSIRNQSVLFFLFKEAQLLPFGSYYVPISALFSHWNSKFYQIWGCCMTWRAHWSSNSSIQMWSPFCCLSMRDFSWDRVHLSLLWATGFAVVLPSRTNIFCLEVCPSRFWSPQEHTLFLIQYGMRSTSRFWSSTA